MKQGYQKITTEDVRGDVECGRGSTASRAGPLRLPPQPACFFLPCLHLHSWVVKIETGAQQHGLHNKTGLTKAHLIFFSAAIDGIDLLVHYKKGIHPSESHSYLASPIRFT